MKYRNLGDSGISVSEICLGSWLTYGVGVDTSAAEACVDRAFDEGINFIDTANIYGKGAAESFLGKALKGRSRDSYILATKLFLPMTETDKGLSRAQIEKQLDASLHRLQTDYIDLYQCHRYDPDTPLEETMEALTRAVASGKVRHIGFSEWSAQNIRDALAIPGRHQVRVQPAAIFDVVAPDRGGSHPALRGQRHFADRLVPARAGRPHRQIQTRQRPSPKTAAPPAMTWAAISRHSCATICSPRSSSCSRSPTKRAAPWRSSRSPGYSREPNIASAIVGASRPDQVSDNARASGLTDRSGAVRQGRSDPRERPALSLTVSDPAVAWVRSRPPRADRCAPPVEIYRWRSLSARAPCSSVAATKSRICGSRATPGPGEALKEDAIFRIASMTKPITSIAVDAAGRTGSHRAQRTDRQISSRIRHHRRVRRGRRQHSVRHAAARSSRSAFSTCCATPRA